MTKDEAIGQLNQGKKLTHRYFLNTEFVFKNSDGLYEFEDGYTVSQFDFWRDRRQLLDDWTVFNEPSEFEKAIDEDKL